MLASASFRVTPADIAAANRKHMRWLAVRPRTWFGLAAFALAAAAVVALTTPGARLVAGVAAVGALLAWMVGWSLVAYAVLPLFARWTHARQPNLHHLWRVELSERGVRGITPNQDAFVAWGDYVAWSEDRRIVLLYNSDRLFQMIPRHALGDAFLKMLHRLVAHLPRR